MGQSRPLFLFIFVLFTFQFKWQIYNLNNINWKKRRWCAWDSNPGRKRIHWAMAAPLTPFSVRFLLLYLSPFSLFLLMVCRYVCSCLTTHVRINFNLKNVSVPFESAALSLSSSSASQLMLVNFAPQTSMKCKSSPLNKCSNVLTTPTRRIWTLRTLNLSITRSLVRSS